MAHVGVFKALHEHGIEPDLIVGSSIGSVFGAVYAYIRDPSLVEGFAERFANNAMLRKMERSLPRRGGNLLARGVSVMSFACGVLHAFWRQGILSEDLVKRYYNNILGEGVLFSNRFLIEDTAIPFAALTTDYRTAEAVAVTKGELPTFLYASSAFPGLCKPVLHGGRMLMDGGIISVVPVIAAHMLGARKIIAVDTEPTVKQTAFKTGIQAINLATDIRGHRLNIVEKSLADVVISPDIKSYKFFEFSKATACKQAGYEATLKALDRIEAAAACPKVDENMSIKRKAMEAFYPFAVI